MDVRTLYLDIDDEITTAAARVRAAEAIRVAMVLPYGSRVATSRINFRLLARDATLNGKRLAIVAGDAATRALAASAGLPIFGSVAEYESSVADERGEEDAGAAAVAAPGGDDPVQPPALAGPPRGPRGSGGHKPRGTATTADDTRATAVSPAEILADGAVSTAPAVGVGSAAALAAIPAERPRPIAPRTPAAVPAARVVADTPPPGAGGPMSTAGSRVLTNPVGRSYGPMAVRTPLVVGAAVLALALVVGGVGAFVFLPTATAVISPRQTAIGPVPLRIVASPTATDPDPATRTVPAVTKTLEVEATQSFEVTGKRVEETSARGTVRFRNKDFTSSNSIPRGSVVSTQGGIRFRTERSVTVPRAELVGLQVFPASAVVRVTAVKAGPDGNVEPNTILVIPRGEDPLTLDVTNPDETSGGKRDEFPRVVQADLTAAGKAIEAQLATKFAEQLADPALGVDGTTVFPDTASLGEPTFTVDPATLLGDEIESFELGASATGTVLAVDESAVRTVAEANIESQVQSGYALVDGSSQIEALPGQVEDGVITFPATITARQVLVIDPTAVEAEIRGKSLADARTILDGYGQAEMSVWPDWVGTIPTLEGRVEVRITEVAEP